jgi:signal transduction histidine kinase
VFRTLLKGRSPIKGLLLALVVTLCAVVLYSWYIQLQISHLRQVQSQLVDRNRRDSLQLLRIQNDLHGVALAMRDMLEGDEPYPLTAWKSQFKRLKVDLDDALPLEDKLAVATRTPEQRQYLSNWFAQFWTEVDQMFAAADAGNDKAAREMVRGSLQTQEAGLSTAVARLLVENNQSEEQAANQIEQVYSRVERQVYLFLAATLTAILFTGVLLTTSNRRLFRKLAELSEQRSDLAHKLIGTQEATFQAISRELHDEFGQVLTAIGSLLARAERKAPPGQNWTEDLREVRQIAQTTLDNIRTLSQALHPVILDEAGLESALDWYLSTVKRQNRINIHFEKSGVSRDVNTEAAIHIYRILQEALNNVIRHSGSSDAWVRLNFREDSLLLEVEDRGSGFQATGDRRGIGLVAMRERTELVGGTIRWLTPAAGGTMVRLEVPWSD